MNGILSCSPAPGAVRLVVAGLLLGLVQGVILLAAPVGMPSPRSLILVLGLLSFGSFVAAIIGDSSAGPRESGRKHRGA